MLLALQLRIITHAALFFFWFHCQQATASKCNQVHCPNTKWHGNKVSSWSCSGELSTRHFSLKAGGDQKENLVSDMMIIIMMLLCVSLTVSVIVVFSAYSANDPALMLIYRLWESLNEVISRISLNTYAIMWPLGILCYKLKSVSQRWMFCQVASWSWRQQHPKLSSFFFLLFFFF